MSSFNNLSEYSKNEFGIIENTFDTKLVDSIRKDFIKKYEKRLPNLNIFNTEDYLFDMMFNKKTVSYFKELIGDFVLLPENVLSIGKFNVSHRDTTSLESANLTIHNDPSFKMFTLGMYLQNNISSNGGGIFVVPTLQNLKMSSLKYAKYWIQN